MIPTCDWCNCELEEWENPVLDAVPIWKADYVAIDLFSDNETEHEFNVCGNCLYTAISNIGRTVRLERFPREHGSLQELHGS